jgi:L-serine deaminase
MRFTACDADGTAIRERAYYSVGGGFVHDEDQAAAGPDETASPGPDLPYPFTTGEELLAHARASGLPVSGIMLANEQALGRTAEQVRAGLADLWQVMQACVERGVQVPCIERNAVASVTAINAARMALRGDGSHFVSLDKAIATMRATGRDMHDKYKETSRGGLAVNVIEC